METNLISIHEDAGSILVLSGGLGSKLWGGLQTWLGPPNLGTSICHKCSLKKQKKKKVGQGVTAKRYGVSFGGNESGLKLIVVIVT